MSVYIYQNLHPHQEEQETLKSKDIEIVAWELHRDIRHCNDNFKSYKQQSKMEGSTCLYVKWSQISWTIGCSFFRMYPGKKTLMYGKHPMSCSSFGMYTGKKKGTVDEHGHNLCDNELFFTWKVLRTKQRNCRRARWNFLMRRYYLYKLCSVQKWLVFNSVRQATPELLFIQSIYTWH